VSTPKLVSDFYKHIWNAGDRSAVGRLLSKEFLFRGSLGTESRGHLPFWTYVCDIRSALAEYHCEIIECVSESDRAFLKMRFSGRHVGVFRGHPPTGLPVHWHGAALFRFDHERIVELWVLGDLATLDQMLRANAAAPSA